MMAGVYRMTCPRGCLFSPPTAEAMPSQQWIAWVHPLSMHVLKLQGRWMHLSWSSTLEIGQWFLFHQMHVTKRNNWNLHWEYYFGMSSLNMLEWFRAKNYSVLFVDSLSGSKPNLPVLDVLKVLNKSRMTSCFFPTNGWKDKNTTGR